MNETILWKYTFGQGLQCKLVLIRAHEMLSSWRAYWLSYYLADDVPAGAAEKIQKIKNTYPKTKTVRHVMSQCLGVRISKTSLSFSLFNETPHLPTRPRIEWHGHETMHKWYDCVKRRLTITQKQKTILYSFSINWQLIFKMNKKF